MSAIIINNISVNGASAANDIGAASGADTPAKVKTIIGTTDVELLQLENITASGIDGLDDGVTYKRMSIPEKTQVDNIVASGLDAIADGTAYKRVTAAGKTAADAIGAASGANVGTQVVNRITEAGFSLSPATGADNLDNIADGTSYKRVTAAEKTALTAGYSALAAGHAHLQELADAEAETALWDYGTAAKMPPALLREIVEASSGGAATVKVDDLGYPSMMYIIRGPILAGHIHADMGSVSGLRTVTLGVGGSGYAENEIVTITQSGGSGGKIRVLTVNSGAILTFEIVEPGTGYAVANGLASTSAGSGVDATFNITAIGPIHNAFSVAGVTKTEILIGMFLSAQYGSGASARAVSWPGLYPTGSLDFDQSKTLHTAKNGGVAGGWHMMTLWEQGLVTWLAMKMNTEPRGNTYYGRAYDSGYEYECGVRSDGLAPGTVSGTAKHRNGSGPDSWSHNAKRWGIHDLVGSMSEWRDGMKIVDGLIKMPVDNDFTLAEASWPSTGVYFDNTTAETGGAPRLSNARTNALIDPNYSSVAHKDMTLTEGFDGLDLVVRQRMLRANLAPKIASAGSNPFNPKGTVNSRNYGERLPVCGGDWNSAAGAGLGGLALGYLRSFVVSAVGSRAAFISLS